MGNVLYLDLGMGAAGDMLAASLFDLLSENEREEFLAEMNHAGLPDTLIKAEQVQKSGISGIHYRVQIHGEEELSSDMHDHAHEHSHEYGHGHEHQHGHGHEHTQELSHEHGHGHTHEHHSMEEILSRVSALALPERVKQDITAIYRDIAQAESRVHGRPVNEVHLHEVGMLDAIADIASVSLLLYKLAPDRICASPITTGFGAVRCAHGILPVPAPATAILLEGMPTRAGQVEGELCTPTGAALIRHFAGSFGQAPEMVPLRTGYGMGSKEFSRLRLNCIRATLGLIDESSRVGCEAAGATDEIIELACTVDDMTGEEIGFAVEELLRGGALDVWTSAVQMKKNRPGTIITVLCSEELRNAMIRLLFRHTSSIGVRETLHRRYILSRESGKKETAYGSIRTKTVSGYGTARSKAEYEDLASIARSSGLSLRDVREACR